MDDPRDWQICSSRQQDRHADAMPNQKEGKKQT